MSNWTKSEKAAVERLMGTTINAFLDEHARLHEAGTNLTPNMVVGAIGGAAYSLLVSYADQMNVDDPAELLQWMTRMVEVIGTATMKRNFRSRGLTTQDVSTK